MSRHHHQRPIRHGVALDDNMRLGGTHHHNPRLLAKASSTNMN
jgi:hypothetical protein